MSSDEAKSIRIVYYISADGPTIILFFQERQHLLKFIETIVDLSKGNVEYFEISQLFTVDYEGLGCLWIGIDIGTGWIRKSVTRVKDCCGEIAFWWSTTADGWEQNLGLLLGLTSGPGHQYLNSHDSDDAVLKISYQEAAN